MMKKLLLPPFIVAALWQLAFVMAGNPALPSPLAVMGRLVASLWVDGAPGPLLKHAWSSLFRVGVAVILATITALAVGLPMGRTRAGKALIRPLVNFFFPLPKIALLPLIIIALGLGEASQIVLVWLVIVFYCTTSLADAAASISPEYYQPLLVQGRSRWELLLHVTLPAVIPELLSAVKTSAATALAVLFMAENQGSRSGLGLAVMNAWTMVDYPGMYAAIVMLGLVGALLLGAIDLIGRRACPWAPRYR
jgi:NitT/TauT family transport system permease protein